MIKLDEQLFKDGNSRWRVSRLITLSKDLPVMDIPMEHLNIYGIYPKLSSTMDFVEHVRKVNNADLDYPIILDEEGYIMDGRHRICHALLNGISSIKAVRFPETPPCCFTIEDGE